MGTSLLQIDEYHSESDEGLNLAQNYYSMSRSDNPSLSVLPTHNESNMKNWSYIVPHDLCHKYYIKGNSLYQYYDLPPLS